MILKCKSCGYEMPMPDADVEDKDEGNVCPECETKDSLRLKPETDFGN